MRRAGMWRARFSPVRWLYRAIKMRVQLERPFAWAIFAAVILAGVVPAAPASSKEFRSDKGYTLTYPDGWEVAPADTRAEIGDAARQVSPGMSGLDVSMIDLMLVPLDGSDQGVNVIVGSGSVPISAATRRHLEESLPQQFARAGMKHYGLTIRQETVGGRAVLFSRCEADLPAAAAELPGVDGSLRLRQWQVIVPGRGRHYIITFSAAAADFSEPELTQILNGFRFDDPPVSPSRGFWEVVGLGALRGALVGGLVALALWVVKRARKKPGSDGGGSQPAGG